MQKALTAPNVAAPAAHDTLKNTAWAVIVAISAVHLLNDVMQSVLLAALLIGIGSSIFHPEASRVARMASGAQPGFAQALFQIGGSLGTALGPLLAALIIVPFGLGSTAWFAFAALAGAVVLAGVGRWSGRHVASFRSRMQAHPARRLTRRQVGWSLFVLGTLTFSKFFYIASFQNYYTFYLMEKFALPLQSAQAYLFAFLFAVAAGTIAGGPIGDRIGRKQVIWGSILGAAPFALLLPYAGIFWTATLSVLIGLIIGSAFPAIVVYAQELVPGKVGAVSGLFFGLSFGLGGIGAFVLGHVADATSVSAAYRICAFLPLIGLVTVFLSDAERR